MPHDTELDRILAALAKPLGRLSDTLLDLRQLAFNPCCAGACVKAYFDLVGEAPDGEEAARPLSALRKWLEARLSIRVIDSHRAVCLETMPLALAGETDLGKFCHTAMQRVREDRCHAGPHLRLEFGFSQDLCAAA